MKTLKTKIPPMNEDKPPVRSAIGAYIYSLRDAREWTQERVANECGLSVPYISYVETGKVMPKLETLDAIARAFGLRVGDILVKAGYTSNPALAWECNQLVRIICREGQLSIEVQNKDAQD